jgi:hypothetical protein
MAKWLGMIKGTTTIGLAACFALLPMQASAQTPAFETAVAVGKSFGFTDAEIERVLHGAVLAKDLKEASDKELAGVVAVWLPNSVAEYADFALEGQHLKLDPSIRSVHVWKRDEPSDKSFADLRLDAAQQSALKGRYEAYRKNGLKGIPGSAGEMLGLAINETRSLDRWPGYAEALLNFPADSSPGMEHRFFSYEQETDGKPTFILSHRAAVRGEHDALISEQRYYVSQPYVCRFIANECFDVRGGTLVYYVSMVFTDQVAGFGSTLKHSVGRRRMLATVAANLKRIREQLKK